MKRQLIFFLIFFVICQAEAKDYKGEIHIEVNRFEQKNDSLFLSLEIDVRSKALKSCQSLIITPFLKDSIQITTFPYVLVNGKNRNKTLSRWQKLQGKNKKYEYPLTVVNLKEDINTLIKYDIATEYVDWMDHSTLVLKEEILDCAGEVRKYTYILSNQIEFEYREPYEVTPIVNFIIPKIEPKQRKMQGKAYLDFPVGKSLILPEFRNNPQELETIHQTIQEVKNNSDITINGIRIQGYASPEGRYATNERLSGDRALALKNYIQQKYNFSKDLFEVNSVAEDWVGFRELVENSSIERKATILTIIDSQDDYDVKENKLKALGYPYGVIQYEMFPQLRRVEYQIDYLVKDYNFEEAKSLVNVNPKHLSQLELFNIANSYTQHTPQFNEIIHLITTLYPNDVTASVNMSAVLLESNDLEAAERYLNNAGNSESAYNNWGVYYLKKGELDKAEVYFRKAITNGNEEASHNLEEVNRKREDNRTR